ncbi:MAG: hypothetical protein OQJ78_09270, partial [Ignavibacteriaceae bacterium]|nr:hypothetical protein [Ignavibacteriaceae bacterium]
AYLSMSDIYKNNTINYKLNTKGNGIYIFLIDGEISVGGETISKRDGIGIWEVEEISIKAIKDSQILLIEIPMN